jgi:hypothetical protein
VIGMDFDPGLEATIFENAVASNHRPNQWRAPSRDRRRSEASLFLNRAAVTRVWPRQFASARGEITAKRRVPVADNSSNSFSAKAAFTSLNLEWPTLNTVVETKNLNHAMTAKAQTEGAYYVQNL